MNSAVCAFAEVYNFVMRGHDGEDDPMADIEDEVRTEWAALPRH
jgi:hypothetical protein